MKWYSSIVLIVLLGAALIWYSRYERQHPSSTGQPAVGTRWFTAIGFDICGVEEGNLSSNPPTKGATPGITTDGDGVLHIAPTKASQAGANATLGAFVAGYQGLVLTSTSVRFPGVRSSGHPEIGRTFTQGDKCPKGTPEAGKPGVVTVQLWTSPTSNTPTVVGEPASLKLGNEQEIEVAYLPQGAKIPKPPAQAITTMLQQVSASAASGGTTSAPTTPAPTASTPASVPTGPASAGSVGSAGSAGSSGSTGATGAASGGSTPK